MTWGRTLTLAIFAEALALAHAFTALPPPLLAPCPTPSHTCWGPADPGHVASSAPPALLPLYNGGSGRLAALTLQSKSSDKAAGGAPGTSPQADAASVAELFPTKTQTSEEDEEARRDRWRRQEEYMESLGATYALLWERQGDKFVGTKDFTTDSRRRALRLVRADGKTL